MALCIANLAACAVLTAFFLSIASLGWRNFDGCSLAMMFLVGFPAASMIVWNYRAVFRRDERAAEGIARVVLFFGLFAALIAILLTVGFVAAVLASWGDNISHILVPLAAWGVASFLMYTGNRYHRWAYDLERDLAAASPEEREQHRRAVRVSRLSMREMFLAVTMVCIILAMAAGFQRHLIKHYPRWGQIQPAGFSLPAFLALSADSGISRSSSTRPPMIVSSMMRGTSLSRTWPYQIS
jgi:hypothetical protein